MIDEFEVLSWLECEGKGSSRDSISGGVRVIVEGKLRWNKI